MFRFKLAADVIFLPKGEKAVVVARAEHLGGAIKYLLQKPSGTAWANDDAVGVDLPSQGPKTK